MSARAMSTHKGGAYPKKKIGRSLVATLALAVAIAFATLAVFAAEARAGSFDSEPPRPS
jgi:hypothetical protein